MIRLIDIHGDRTGLITWFDKAAILSRFPHDFFFRNIFTGEIMKKLSLEDWIFYRTLAYWEPLEASCLLNGIDPQSIDSEIPKGIGRILSSIERSVRTREIDTEEQEIAASHPFFKHREKWGSFIREPNDSYCPDYTICTFNPYAFLRWADKKGFHIQNGFDGWEEGRFTMNTPEGTKVIFNDFSSESSDIIQSEEPPLAKKEALELGRLRVEKVNWESSLCAAVAIGQHIGTLEYKYTRKALKDFMQKMFPEIEGKTMNNRLWKSIPEDVKNDGGGAPKQPIETI